VTRCLDSRAPQLRLFARPKSAANGIVTKTVAWLLFGVISVANLWLVQRLLTSGS
jgi:hypothetical protein